MDVVTTVNTKTGLDRFDTVPIGAEAKYVTMENGMSLQTAGQNIENWHSEVANMIEVELDKVTNSIKESTESTLVGAIDNLTDKIDISNDVRQQVAANTSNISSLNTTVSNHTTNINDLNDTTASHTSSIGSLNVTVGSHSNSIETLNNEVEDIDTSIEDINDQIGSEDISDIGSSITDAIVQLDNSYGKCLIVNFGQIGGSGGSVTETRYSDQITEDMVVVSYQFGSRMALINDLTWTTADGSVTISGTFSSSTTLTLALAPSILATVTSTINQG